MSNTNKEIKSRLSLYDWTTLQYGDVLLCWELGMPGCATVKQVGNYYDIAIWWAKPVHVAIWIKGEGPCPDHDTRYVQVSMDQPFHIQALVKAVMDEVQEDRPYMEG